MKRYQLLIDGEWRDPLSGIWTPDINPANTDDVIGEFAWAGVEDVTAAVEAAVRAFPIWRGTPMVKRGTPKLDRRITLSPDQLEQLRKAMMGVVSWRTIPTDKTKLDEYSLPAAFAERIHGEWAVEAVTGRHPFARRGIDSPPTRDGARG